MRPYKILALGCQSTPPPTEGDKRTAAGVSRALAAVVKKPKTSQPDPREKCARKTGRCPVCNSLLSVGCGSQLYITGTLPLKNIRLVMPPGACETPKR